MYQSLIFQILLQQKHLLILHLQNLHLSFEDMKLKFNPYQNIQEKENSNKKLGIVDSKLSELNNQIENVKNDLINDLESKITIDELVSKYDISKTTLKNCFKEVYGKPIY